MIVIHSKARKLKRLPIRYLDFSPSFKLLKTKEVIKNFRKSTYKPRDSYTDSVKKWGNSLRGQERGNVLLEAGPADAVPDGKVVYNWEDVGELYDRMLYMGLDMAMGCIG